MRFIACRPQGSEVVNQFYDDDLLSQLAKGQFWTPDLDIIEEKDQYVLKADLPGIKKEDIKISVQDDILSIEGERQVESVTEESQVHRYERTFGRFTRSLNLGSKVDVAKIKANYKDGVLELFVPKSEEVKPRSVDIQVN